MYIVHLLHATLIAGMCNVKIAKIKRHRGGKIMSQRSYKFNSCQSHSERETFTITEMLLSFQ